MDIRTLRQQIHQIGIAFDQFVNALLGLIPALRRRGFGDADETISSVVGKLTRRGSKSAAAFCWFLSFFDKGHCTDAIEEDEGRLPFLIRSLPRRRP